jgi:hypothetical protein
VRQNEAAYSYHRRSFVDCNRKVTGHAASRVYLQSAVPDVAPQNVFSAAEIGGEAWTHQGYFQQSTSTLLVAALEAD